MDKFESDQFETERKGNLFFESFHAACLRAGLPDVRDADKLNQADGKAIAIFENWNTYDGINDYSDEEIVNFAENLVENERETFEDNIYKLEEEETEE